MKHQCTRVHKENTPQDRHVKESQYTVRKHIAPMHYKYFETLLQAHAHTYSAQDRKRQRWLWLRSRHIYAHPRKSPRSYVHTDKAITYPSMYIRMQVYNTHIRECTVHCSGAAYVATAYVARIIFMRPSVLVLLRQCHRPRKARKEVFPSKNSDLLRW